MARATWCKCQDVNMANIDNTNRGPMNQVLIIIKYEKNDNILNIDNVLLAYLQSKYGEYIKYSKSRPINQVLLNSRYEKRK